jgi:isovaleryl-CoA dehydrogenase
LALTEPGAGSDAVSIKTRAVKKGNEYILNGSKTFITNGPIADTLIVYAKTDSQGGAKGISAFIVEKDFPGFKVARKLEKMGMRGSPTAELFFDDCRVPAENLLGKEHLGIDVMMSGLDLERAFLTGLPLGMAQAAFELSVKYARERVQFGRPIASFQLIQAKLADMYTQIEAARLYCYQVARLAQSAEHGGKGTTIHKRAASALLFAAEMCERVTYEAVQIHGGYGYMLEYPVQRLMRDARLMTIGAGTSEIRRLVVAREILSQD